MKTFIAYSGLVLAIILLCFAVVYPRSHKDLRIEMKLKVTNQATDQSYLVSCVRFVDHGEPRLDTLNSCIEELMNKSGTDDNAALERGENVKRHSIGE